MGLGKTCQVRRPRVLRPVQVTWVDVGTVAACSKAEFVHVDHLSAGLRVWSSGEERPVSGGEPTVCYGQLEKGVRKVQYWIPVQQCNTNTETCSSFACSSSVRM